MARSIEMIAEYVFPFDGSLGIKQHTHSFHQIFYALEGAEDYEYDGTIVHVCKGEFLFVLPQKEHGLPSSRPDSKVLDLKFHVCDSVLNKKLFSLPPHIHCSQSVQTIFQLIEQEAEKKEPYYDEIISNLLEAILFSVLREQCPTFSGAGINTLNLLGCNYENLSECVRRTVLRIEGAVVLGPDQSLLDETALALGYSKSYMCRRFSEEIGMSILQYVTMLRMDKAKELLLNSDRSIHQISTLLYFNDVTRFCKVFKKHTGLTPTQYRSAPPPDERALLYSYRDFS